MRAENAWSPPTPEGGISKNEMLLDSGRMARAVKLHMNHVPGRKPRRKRNFDKSPFFVYDEPLSFVPPADEVTSCNVAFYKAVLLFNIAFVLHKKSNCVDAWSVYRALHFYELCLDCCSDCAGHPSCLEVSAAALNNKAHIYFEHCEFSTSRTILDTLLVTMIFTHRRPLELEEKNSQGILFNLYMLRMPTAARIA